MVQGGLVLQVSVGRAVLAGLTGCCALSPCVAWRLGVLAGGPTTIKIRASISISTNFSTMTSASTRTRASTTWWSHRLTLAWIQMVMLLKVLRFSHAEHPAAMLFESPPREDSKALSCKCPNAESQRGLQARPGRAEAAVAGAVPPSRARKDFKRPAAEARRGNAAWLSPSTTQMPARFDPTAPHRILHCMMQWLLRGSADPEGLYLLNRTPISKI